MVQILMDSFTLALSSPVALYVFKTYKKTTGYRTCVANGIPLRRT